MAANPQDLPLHARRRYMAQFSGMQVGSSNFLRPVHMVPDALATGSKPSPVALSSWLCPRRDCGLGLSTSDDAPAPPQRQTHRSRLKNHT
eukprot:2594449-Amphidinium_carterae.1